MPPQTSETIPGLLIRNLPRDLVMGIEDALGVGAQRAHAAARGMDEGHLPHVVGQLRHFHMNETFHRALEANGASPSPIRGGGVVTGRAGIFRIARLNVSERAWNNARRSFTRRQMSIANLSLEPLVQPMLFGAHAPPSDGVVFFVSCFPRTIGAGSESPSSLQIAVPYSDMGGWMFRETLGVFLSRYERVVAQADLAVPKLKAGLRRLQGNGEDLG